MSIAPEILRHEQPLGFRPQQSSGAGPVVLDHQDCRHHARRDRRGRGLDVDESGLSARNRNFAVIFLIAVVAQIRARQFHPSLYWTTIIATTTVGTTLADSADRSLGIGYAGGSTLLLALLLISLATWYRTLGTALGDWTAAAAGLGCDGAALIFGALLAAVLLVFIVASVAFVLRPARQKLHR